MNVVWMHLQQVFEWICRTSLSAALLAILVLAAQKILSRWLTPFMRYSLSLLVLVRLLLPISPSSPLSVENLLRLRSQPGKPAPLRITHDAAGKDTKDRVSPKLVVPVPPSPRLSFKDWLGLGWAAGCLVLLLLAVRRYKKWNSLIGEGRPIADARLLHLFEGACREMDVRRQVQLICVPGLGSPAVFGLWRARLLLPEDALDQLKAEDWRAIFLHELAHVRRHDTALNLLLIAVQFLHWFNPLVWLATHRLRADRELVCDAMALQHLSADQRQAYGQVLLRLINEFSTETPVFAGAVPVVGSKEEIKRRLIMIKHHERGGVGAGLATVLAVAALTCATFTRAEDNAPKAVSLRSGPHIEFDAVEYDFGQAPPGSVVPHTFIVTNTGDAVLEITNIRPACGCTTVRNYPRTIAPGGSAAIPVQLNVSRSATSIHKTLSVYSNAKDQAKIVLVLKGTVSKPGGANVQTPVKLSLPESTQPKTGASADAVIVTIPKSGQIYFKTIPVTMEALEQRLKEAADANPDVTVSIHADEATPWGEMVKVRDAAYAAKIKNVNASVNIKGSLD